MILTTIDEGRIARQHQAGSHLMPLSDVLLCGVPQDPSPIRSANAARVKRWRERHPEQARAMYRHCQQIRRLRLAVARGREGLRILEAIGAHLTARD